MKIINEEEPQFSDIRKVHELAFGQKTEAQLVEALRKGKRFRSGMSLVALKNQTIVGHILFSELKLLTENREIKAAALAPIAVLPEWQKQGIGTQLIQRGLMNLGKLGFEAVLVLGDPKYYSQFGFKPEYAAGINCPYSGEYLMGFELRDGVLSHLKQATATYAPEFEGLE